MKILICVLASLLFQIHNFMLVAQLTKTDVADEDGNGYSVEVGYLPLLACYLQWV